MRASLTYLETVCVCLNWFYHPYHICAVSPDVCFLVCLVAEWAHTNDLHLGPSQLLWYDTCAMDLYADSKTRSGLMVGRDKSEEVMFLQSCARSKPQTTKKKNQITLGQMLLNWKIMLSAWPLLSWVVCKTFLIKMGLRTWTEPNVWTNVYAAVPG